MNNQLPGILVTGASGFIGRHFVIAISGKFRIFCVARRSQKEAGVPENDQTHWLQADITKWKNLQRVYEYVQEHGGADYVLHLAGYYDFTLTENPVYEETNVTGTRYLLELSKMLGVKRFIFSSSLAACKFPPAGTALTEKSLVDGDFPYARSKRRAEAIIEEYSETLPCSIVRLAAVFSDWCEYPILYMLLNSWLSGKTLLSKTLGGHGESAVPYIHIKDLIKLFLRIINISDTLPQLGVYIAGFQGSVSQIELFRTATRYYYGHDVKPIKVPKTFARLGLIVLSFWGWLTGKETIEKPWMAEYIDKKLNIDASVTFKALDWKPTPRYHILRRLLFITEKMITNPKNWEFRNELLLQRVAYRKSTEIYNILVDLREPLVNLLVKEVKKPENEDRFPNYQKMDQDLLKWYITLNYQLVSATVRNRDRAMIPNYAQVIAYRRFVEGFKAKEVKDLMFLTAKTMEESLLGRSELKDSKQRVDDYIILTAQLAIDEFEDTYEILETYPPDQVIAIDTIKAVSDSHDLKRIVLQLEDICSDSLSHQLSGIF
ncbi:MAG TPA: NAD(P)-dependent oxidoreductase [Desulfobacterales bacterium]|nr:NAD(P)-dependent oxidoreductase [Desulfobacterales bacterium]